MTISVLNLYAGIGGNRKHWRDVDVTAVELDPEIAEVYQDNYPDDTVVVGDAHGYLLENFKDYEFIWASPPCPTHSDFRRCMHQYDKPVYPDMKLWQEIILLMHTYRGEYVVENVIPYYDPLIPGQRVSRHMFWSSYHIPKRDFGSDTVKRQDGSCEELEERYGFDLDGYGFGPRKRRKILNNCVNPELGRHVFESGMYSRQLTVHDL